MSAFWKDLTREIRFTIGRFLSLLVITALGAMSVVGIQATAIDMRAIADKMYKEHNLYDLQLKSTMGFGDDDIAALMDAEGISAIMPTTIFDVFVSIDNENRAVRTYALPDGVNTIDLIEGRFPESKYECAVERRLLRDGRFTVGDTIRFNLDDEIDYYDFLASDVFTIVGVVSTPLYVTFQRGNTLLGDGTLAYYLYLHPEAYALDVFTDIYLLMDGSKDIDNVSDEYYDAADGWKKRIEATGTLRAREIADELADAQKEIDDGWIEYFDGLKEFEEKIAEGRQELLDAKAELINAKAELEDGQRELDESVAEALSEIESQEKELEDGRRELDARRNELNAGQAQLLDARRQAEETLAALAQMGPEGVSPELDAYYLQAREALAMIELEQLRIDEGRNAIAYARRRMDDGARQLSEARETLEQERAEAQAEIDDGWVKYFEGHQEYEDGVITLDAEEADALIELDDAKRELMEAQEKLDDAPDPEWFYFTRKDGIAFDSYYQDTLRLAQIGYVFPLVFFIVAILVTLTTMTRMVEEHRTQIGIYVALGYRRAATMTKYLLYAFSSGALGGVAGVFLGSKIFPLIIADAYGHLYNMPPVETPIPGLISVIAVAAAVLAVVAVTFFTCLGSMTGSPAMLMRPKPPKSGKRVWLERISPVWNRLGFFSKVTARNIFRYKPRFIMTLFGVAGCSALLITAFGLSDSINGVDKLQFESIVRYDARAYLRDISTPGQREDLGAVLPQGHLYIREEAVDANGDKGGLSASLIVPDAPEKLNEYFYLVSPYDGSHVDMTSRSVLITEKLSRVTGAEVGDSFTMTRSDGRSFETVVSGVVDNYILHYIYMPPDLYKEIFNESPFPNSVLLFYEDGREAMAPLLDDPDVRAIIYNEDLKEMIGDQTDAMGIVTIVLIVIACALALVVLFNLTNINISERIRELATIKVLGFYDLELAMYIYRENAIVTLLGVVTGVICGILLHSYVITTVEIDILKFPKIIRPISFVTAVVLSLVFAVFVNIVMNFKLARIDMVESLKNVE